jgi:UDPglucose 6-dehydrogenase
LPRVTVIGTGYLGLTHAVAMADFGHDVLAIDVDEAKIAKAARGEVPFFEPGLEPLLRKNLESGRLRFTMSFAAAGSFGEVHFLCVGTPEGEAGQADLSYVQAAVGALAPHLRSPCLIVGKSTVPVGTARQVLHQVRAIAPAGQEVELAWNPEFLREGHAVRERLAPDRIVLGVTSDRAEARMRQVYAAPLEAGTPLLVTDLETAELVKVAANAFLATKISFINAMAEICEEAGADVIPLAEALGYDPRIGRRFLSPGLGYGGGCLPKDVRAFRATARTLGVDSVVSLLSTVDAVNAGRRDRVLTLARETLGGTLEGRRVTVLGVAFKPNSDDVRDSPSLDICDRLAAERAVVSVHDPVAMPNAAKKRPGLAYAPTVSAAAAGAELVLHLTEWSDYQAIDPAALAQVVARPVLIDARCCLDAGLWSDAGWSVRVLGRPPRGVWGDRSPQERGGLGGRPPTAKRASAASTTLVSSMARVIGPTPPGMGASQPATSATSAATSPTSPVPVRVIPTSTTAAPGLTMSAVSRPGRPAATTTMSAVLVCAARSLVPVWQSVTVAFSVRLVSSRPSARPTVMPRPTTVTSAPAMGTP